MSRLESRSEGIRKLASPGREFNPLGFTEFEPSPAKDFLATTPGNPYVCAASQTGGMLTPPNTVNNSPYVPPVDPIAPLRAALRGHYDTEREIGQGAFATVYLARDLKHERKVAVKVLNADPTSDIGELRFIREIRTLEIGRAHV